MAGLAARPLLVAAALLAGVTFGGCGNKGIGNELHVFKEAGRAVSEFADVDGSALQAKKCQAGTIDNIAALLCEYASLEKANQGQAAAENWLGETSTGLVLRRELLLLALSDRNHTDPNGKAISAISKLFRRVSKR
jgi:hypothetical protein